MAEVLDFVLYDTWQPSTTASAEAVLFQTPQGGDSTHTEAFTNMMGAGSLPESLKFTVNQIRLEISPAATQANLRIIATESFLEFRVGGKDYVKAPISFFAGRANFAGQYTLETAADACMMGFVAEPHALQFPIVIPGGTAFRIRAVQGAALGATTNVKVLLVGNLERD